MKILVTGANSLLGHHVVMELLNRNEDVKIIVRSTKNIHFDLKKIDLVEGNFTNLSTIRKAVSGCDAIIHIAALTDTNLLSYEDYKIINTDATKQLLEVAKEQSISDFVYVSTANTIGYGNISYFVDEEAPIQYPFSLSYYAQSKLESEYWVKKYADSMHTIIINPAFMIGNYDTKPSSGKIITMGFGNLFRFIPSGGKNFVPVKNVAVSCCNALKMGISGERYLASGVNLSFKDFYKLLAKILNKNQIIFIIPDFLLLFFGFAGDILRLFKIKTSLCSINMKQLIIKGEYYSNAKIRNELQMPQTSIENAIKEALDWFIKNKYIKI